jgi:hypothetical protein
VKSFKAPMIGGLGGGLSFFEVFFDCPTNQHFERYILFRCLDLCLLMQFGRKIRDVKPYCSGFFVHYLSPSLCVADIMSMFGFFFKN